MALHQPLFKPLSHPAMHGMGLWQIGVVMENMFQPFPNMQLGRNALLDQLVMGVHYCTQSKVSCGADA